MPRFVFPLVLALTLAGSQLASATTYYVRTDGGPPERCDGKADTAAPATGTGQPCAWDHPFRALPPGEPPRMASGDTLIIGSGSYMMGFGAAGASSCEADGAWGCHMPPVPGGESAAQPTRILGAGWDRGCTAPPELWGTERADSILDLSNADNVEIGCLVLTDHSSCVESHSGAIACRRDTPPFGPWAVAGIYAQDSKNVRLSDLYIHGFAGTGVHAGRLTDWTVERVRIAGNGWSGWDGDMDGTDSNSGALTFRKFTVEWNGCGETYPGGQPTGCWAQTAGGYGDGFGTGETGGNWLFEDSAFLHNTSDGLDLLYAREGSTITIRRTRAEGNAGNQLKTNGPALIENSIAVGDCAFFNGKAFTHHVDDCRALGNTLSLSLRPGDLVRLINNTVTGQGDCLAIADCFGGGACNGTERVRARNNIFIGGTEFLSPDDRACFFYQEAFPHGDSLFDIDYHFVSGVKDDACPGEHTVCNVSPGLVNASLVAFDAHLLSASPAIGFASKPDAPAIDFDGHSRDASPDLGAYEFLSGGSTCTLTCAATVATNGTTGSPVAFSATAQPAGCTGTPTFDWDFGDGSTHGSGPSVTHTYAGPGVRNWQLLVTLAGASCTQTGSVSISGSPLSSFLVPAVTHGPGLADSVWRTNVTAVNRAGVLAKLDFTFVPTSGALRTATATVSPNGTKEWTDVVTSLFLYEQAASISGALHITSDQSLVVTSRTFNQGATGTFGGLLAAVSPSTAIPAGVVGVLSQLKNNSRFRTNIGAGNLLDESVTLAVRLYDESGRLLGHEVSINLPPAGFVQVTDAFAAAEAGNADLAYALVEVKTPLGRAGVYASVIDNDTNDPVIVPVVFP